MEAVSVSLLYLISHFSLQKRERKKHLPSWHVLSIPLPKDNEKLSSLPCLPSPSHAQKEKRKERRRRRKRTPFQVNLLLRGVCVNINISMLSLLLHEKVCSCLCGTGQTGFYPTFCSLPLPSLSLPTHAHTHTHLPTGGTTSHWT